MLSLDEVPVGQKVRVVEFHSSALGIRQKLLAMGLIPGVILQVLRAAPLGDPLQIRLRGYNLSLRKKECQQIIVEEIEPVVNQNVLSNDCASR